MEKLPGNEEKIRRGKGGIEQKKKGTRVVLSLSETVLKFSVTSVGVSCAEK